MTTQLEMANALLRKSEAAKIERIEQLESLVRDLYECGKYECNDACPHHDTDTKKFCEFGPAGWLNERMAALGLLGGDWS